MNFKIMDETCRYLFHGSGTSCRFFYREHSDLTMTHLDCHIMREELKMVYLCLARAESHKGLYTCPADERNTCFYIMTAARCFVIRLVMGLKFGLETSPALADFCQLTSTT